MKGPRQSERFALMRGILQAPPGRSTTKLNRREEIVRRRIAGETLATIASDYGITKQCVAQTLYSVRKWGERSTRTPFPYLPAGEC